MDRSLFSEEDDIFPRNFWQFVETRVVPQRPEWRKQGVVDREIWLEAYESGWSASLHSDVIVPYIHRFGSGEQQAKVAARLCQHRDQRDTDGDDYMINGAKTFISNGMSCDLAGDTIHIRPITSLGW